MEITAAIDLFADRSKRMEKHLEHLSFKPIQKVIGGSGISVGAGTPLIIVLDDAPSVGRIWNLLTLGIFGNDPHTPSVTPGVNNVTVPAATTASVQLNGYQALLGFDLTLSAGGTAAGTVTVSNIAKSPLSGNTTLTYDIPIGATSLSIRYPQPLYTATANGPKVTVNAITGAGAGDLNVYSGANPFALTTGAGVSFGSGNVDVCIGSSPQADLQQPSLSDVILMNQSIPTTYKFARRSEWIHFGDRLYIVAYGVPNLSQVAVIARVHDYPVEAEEALAV